MGLKRKPEWLLNSVVVPSVLIVAIAYCSFFIARAAVPARVGMTVTCFLTLQNMSSSIRAGMPPISESVRLLNFVSWSQFFVFYAIAEYCVANWLMRLEKRIEKA